MENLREKAKEIHGSVNHKYSGYDYVLHLDAVKAAFLEFEDEIDVLFTVKTAKITAEFPVSDIYLNTMMNQLYTEKPELLTNEIISRAVFFHDVEEDCRMTYNDIKAIIGETAADIVHAVTNHKGKTRKERANADYYEEIRETPGASFVKMCDRIANVRFSRLMGSTMFSKYQEENQHFMKMVDADRFPKMKECLINLFK